MSNFASFIRYSDKVSDIVDKTILPSGWDQLINTSEPIIVSHGNFIKRVISELAQHAPEEPTLDVFIGYPKHG